MGSERENIKTADELYVEKEISLPPKEQARQQVHAELGRQKEYLQRLHNNGVALPPAPDAYGDRGFYDAIYFIALAEELMQSGRVEPAAVAKKLLREYKGAFNTLLFTQACQKVARLCSSAVG